MLLLFDIDGTLVRTAGAGRRALEAAFADLFGIQAALEGIRLDGNTDPLIYASMFSTHFGRSPTAPEESALRERYLQHLRRTLEDVKEDYRVLPGVLGVLARARASGWGLGLCTGNIEAGARLKLQPGGLDVFFAFGGFGSDHAERSILVERAIERSGRATPLSEIALFGDTERDVEAARTVGIRSVGVAAGASDVDRLSRSAPDLLLDSLEDEDTLWRWLTRS